MFKKVVLLSLVVMLNGFFAFADMYDDAVNKNFQNKLNV